MRGEDYTGAEVLPIILSIVDLKMVSLSKKSTLLVSIFEEMLVFDYNSLAVFCSHDYMYDHIGIIIFLHTCTLLF